VITVTFFFFKYIIKLIHSSFCSKYANNTNCNFGKNNSLLYAYLKKYIPYLIKANCHAYIIHNSVRYAMNYIYFDIENVILKIYAHFLQSSVRRETFKNFLHF